MDLTRIFRRLVPAAGLAAAVAGCGSENPATFSDDAILLPATLLEAYSLAESLARDWNPGAYPTRLGGGFTVMDAEGRAFDHSFEFYARFGLQWRRLTLHLLSGAPWMQESSVGTPPPSFTPFPTIDSREAVHVARQTAEFLNQSDPGRIPIPEQFAARLLSVPVWPESLFVYNESDSVAWRVDFLELGPLDPDGAPPDLTPVWWSLVRFYVNPWSGQLIGEPTEPGRELYPFP